MFLDNHRRRINQVETKQCNKVTYQLQVSTKYVTGTQSNCIAVFRLDLFCIFDLHFSQDKISRIATKVNDKSPVKHESYFFLVAKRFVLNQSIIGDLRDKIAGVIQLRVL